MWISVSVIKNQNPKYNPPGTSHCWRVRDHSPERGLPLSCSSASWLSPCAGHAPSDHRACAATYFYSFWTIPSPFVCWKSFQPSDLSSNVPCVCRTGWYKAGCLTTDATSYRWVRKRSETSWCSTTILLRSLILWAQTSATLKTACLSSVKSGASARRFEPRGPRVIWAHLPSVSWAFWLVRLKDQACLGLLTRAPLQGFFTWLRPPHAGGPWG